MNVVEPRSARKQPAVFCLDFEQAQIALGLIIAEGDGQVVEEGQRLVLPE